MIIRKQKPTYAAHCNVCGGEIPLESTDISNAIDAEDGPALTHAAARQTAKLGFMHLTINVQNAVRCERGHVELMLCPLCLREVVETLFRNAEIAKERWAEWSIGMADETKARVNSIFGSIIGAKEGKDDEE